MLRSSGSISSDMMVAFIASPCTQIRVHRAVSPVMIAQQRLDARGRVTRALVGNLLETRLWFGVAAVEVRVFAFAARATSGYRRR